MRGNAGSCFEQIAEISIRQVYMRCNIAKLNAFLIVRIYVADAVFYFAAHARNTTGAELVVDGGNTI